jgi:septal ring factor EnvC (AmiA/AmiB activator)
MADATTPVSGPTVHHDDKHVGAPFAIRATVFVLAVVIIILAYAAYHEKALLTDTKAQLTRANTDSNQAKSDLDQARSQATGLQTQVDQLKSQQTALQSQVADAQGKQADLQAQIVKAQGLQADLKSRLDNANNQSAGLQAELARANNSAADARKQLDQANSHANDLQAQLDKAKTDATSAPLAAAALKALPVAATFEKGFWGGKYTMHVKNQGTDPLPINLTVDGGAVKSATVQPGMTYDMDDLKSGSNVVVSSDGFQTDTLTVK